MGVNDTILKKVDKLKDKYEEREEQKSSFSKLTNVVEEVEEKTIKDTAMEEGIKQLFTTENLEMKTELSAPLVLHMARGKIFEKYFHSKVMGDFINNIQVLSVSKGRKGRQEFVSLVRNSQEFSSFDEGDSMRGIARVLGK